MPTQTISKLNNIASLYDIYESASPNDARLSKEYVWVESLTLIDAEPILRMPALHNAVMHVPHICTTDLAVRYLNGLKRLRLAFDNDMFFKAFYMLNCIMLHISLWDRQQINLFYLLYAVCLSCFDYSYFQERM